MERTLRDRAKDWLVEHWGEGGVRNELVSAISLAMFEAREMEFRGVFEAVGVQTVRRRPGYVGPDPLPPRP